MAPESPATFHSSPPNLGPSMHPGFGMSHSTMPTFEMAMAIWRLEQDFSQLRQSHANLVAEVAQLRTRGASSSRIDRLEEAVLKAVKPGRPLHKGEEPGFDCERHIEDYPDARFFKDGAHTAHKKSKKGTTTVGKNAPKRGRPKKDECNNEAYEYLENPDGTTVSERDYAVARTWACNYLDICKSLDITLADSWKDVDVRVKSIFYASLRKILTCSQMCQNNSKGRTLMNGVYYDMIVRKRKKAATGHDGGASKARKAVRVKLDDAPYKIPEDDSNIAIVGAQTIVQDSDNSEVSNDSGTDDSDSDGEDGGKPKRATGPKSTPASVRSSKRPLDSDISLPTLSKKARTIPVQSVLSPSTSAPSGSGPTREEKGKQRALGAVLADNCMALLDKEPRPDLQVPLALSAARLSRPMPKPAKKKKKGDLTLAINTDMPPPSFTGAALAFATSPTSSSIPASPFLSTVSPSTASTSASSTDMLTPTSASSGPGNPIKAEGSASATMSTSGSACMSSMPGAVDTAMSPVESKPTITPSLQVVVGARKSHARKASGWPPNEDMTGPKWDYARAWHADHSGTLDEFQKHYADLYVSVKNRIRAHYNKGKKNST
ncbi:hypothetical protein K466DRAFT_605942 [Polyporus arcularius HHB13444]|uniref:Uncharacterized protein n=1 Tax=Polyporus arcularius HHB13444 TaxID=1314778 RepID=A0A5C3NTH9_9APHY|nr:hypothetical protein K466DRAFT_605942 [Polyporus arcularius HHB13444]